MSKDVFIIDKKLLESLVNENIRLRAELEQYKSREPLQPQIMEKQISIEEYIKTLKKGNNGIQKNI